MGLLPALVGFELMGGVASLEGEAATQQKQPAIVNNQHQTTVLVVIVLPGCGRVVVWSVGVNSSWSWSNDVEFTL
jgi:hypothetical protein